MEIIYLVLVLSLKGQLKIQKEEYHTYAEKWKVNIPCETYIRRKKTEREIRKRFRVKQGDIDLHCVRSSEYEAWEAKMNPSENESVKSDKEESEFVGILKKVEETRLGKTEMGDNGYQGTNYFLSSETDHLPIHGTDSVKAAQLDQFVEKKVKITGEYFEKMPHPMEQAPISYNPVTGESQTLPRRGVKTKNIQVVK